MRRDLRVLYPRAKECTRRDQALCLWVCAGPCGWGGASAVGAYADFAPRPQLDLSTSIGGTEHSYMSSPRTPLRRICVSPKLTMVTMVITDKKGTVISFDDMFTRLDWAQRRVAEELDSPFQRTSVLSALVTKMGFCMRTIAKIIELEALVELPAFKVLTEVQARAMENSHLHYHGWGSVRDSVAKALKPTTWEKVSELAKITANTETHDLLEHFRMVERMQLRDSDDSSLRSPSLEERRSVKEYRRAATEEYEAFHVWLRQMGKLALYERWRLHRQGLYDCNCVRFPPVELGSDSLDKKEEQQVSV